MSTYKHTDLPYYRYTEVFDEQGEISCGSSHCNVLVVRVRVRGVSDGHVTREYSLRVRGANGQR